MRTELDDCATTSSESDDLAPVSPARAELHETHSGVVILLGDLAYKLKKPVDLGFLDFRTPAARDLACRRELTLNRRLTPDVYLDVATFARTDATPDESVLVMRRMPDDRRLSTLINGGGDVHDELRLLARRIADFHAGAARSPAISAAAGPAGLLLRWQDNLRETERYAGTVLDADLLDDIKVAALRFVAGRTALLTERAADGYAVDGHGDLICDDIFCLADGPRVLDCLDFDDTLRWVDVLDDVCFLAMDIERLGRADLAARLLDCYAEFSGSPVPQSLRHHYVAYRAFVRAKVACIRASQGDPAAAANAVAFARLASLHLESGRVRLVLVGGAPGSGKTTVAAALAERFDARLLSTDMIRRERPRPEAGRYTRETKNAVYRAMLDRAGRLLEHGESVVADATWGDLAWRHEAEALATSTSSELVQLECEAPLDLTARRAEKRLQAGTDASEAGADVARRLAAHRDPWLGATAVDTSGAVERAVDDAVELVTVSRGGHRSRTPPPGSGVPSLACPADSTRSS